MENNLRELYEQLCAGKTLEDELTKAKKDQTHYQNRCKEAEKRLYYERRDVERLEKTSIANAVYRLSGKLESRLERERGDVSQAQAEYEKAAEALKQSTARVEALKREAMLYGEKQRRFDQLLEDKRLWLREAGTEISLELVSREQVVKEHAQRLRELEEAERAGQRALAAAERAIECLDSADGYATWDLLGGGMIADLAKHGRLDEAEQHMEALRSQLSLFEKELNDVALDADIQVNVEGFLRMADYWFDNLFTDWTVKSRIEESHSQVQRIHQKIERLLQQIAYMKNETQRHEAYARQELQQWLIDAPITEA